MGVGQKRDDRVVYDEQVEVAVPAEEIDEEWLKWSFAEAFERGARAIQRAGYDQDDGIIERFLTCTWPGGGPVRVEALWLSDAERMKAHVRAAVESEAGRTVGGAEIEIVGLSLRVLLDPQWKRPES